MLAVCKRLIKVNTHEYTLWWSHGHERKSISFLTSNPQLLTSPIDYHLESILFECDDFISN